MCWGQKKLDGQDMLMRKIMNFSDMFAGWTTADLLKKIMLGTGAGDSQRGRPWKECLDKIA